MGISKTLNKSMDNFYSLDNSSHIDPRYSFNYNLDILSKKDNRKLHSIIRSNWWISMDELEKLKSYKSISDAGISITDISFVHELYDKIGLSQRERKNHWIHNRLDQKGLRDEYKKMPKRVRKDNQEILNRSSGRSSRDSIRVPSKKRNAKHWKKFHALFPHLDPSNIKS